MEIALKAKKIRDRVIYAFNVIPQNIDIKRHVVYVEIRQKDIDRLKLDVTAIEKSLELLLDRRVEVKKIDE